MQVNFIYHYWIRIVILYQQNNSFLNFINIPIKRISCHPFRKVFIKMIRGKYLVDLWKIRGGFKSKNKPITIIITIIILLKGIIKSKTSTQETISYSLIKRTNLSILKGSKTGKNINSNKSMSPKLVSDTFNLTFEKFQDYKSQITECTHMPLIINKIENVKIGII